MPGRQCLPIADVLETMKRIEGDVATFYRAAIELAGDDEAKDTFNRLLAQKEDAVARLGPVCDALGAGHAEEVTASDGDLVFLSSLAYSAFYRQAGSPARTATPELRLRELVENALKLEKDLLLFYIRFYGVSCADHRPLMAELIQRGERHIGDLANLKSRLRDE